MFKRAPLRWLALVIAGFAVGFMAAHRQDQGEPDTARHFGLRRPSTDLAADAFDRVYMELEHNRSRVSIPYLAATSKLIRPATVLDVFTIRPTSLYADPARESDRSAIGYFDVAIVKFDGAGVLHATTADGMLVHLGQRRPHAGRSRGLLSLALSGGGEARRGAERMFRPGARGLLFANLHRDYSHADWPYQLLSEARRRVPESCGYEIGPLHAWFDIVSPDGSELQSPLGGRRSMQQLDMHIRQELDLLHRRWAHIAKRETATASSASPTSSLNDEAATPKAPGTVRPNR